MGACVSKTRGGEGRRLRFSKKSWKRRCGLRKKVSSHMSNESLDKVDLSDHSLANPTFQAGTTEEVWFDSVAVFDSDCDDDYQSVADEMKSLDGTEANGGFDGSIHEANGHVSVNTLFNKDDKDFYDQGILPNNFLSCRSSTDKISLCFDPNAINKAPAKHSFRTSATATLFSSKTFLRKPLAGLQVPFCPIEKKMLDCWSHIDPSTFKVRGANYLKDKKRDFSPNYAAYYPFGLDVFLSPRKVNNIARFVELPVTSSSSKLPPILVVNVQIPLYPASIFESEYDGEGVNFVLYCKLSESYASELPLSYQENIRKLMIDGEVEKVKGFPRSSTVPFRDRLKILGHLVNPEDLHLNAAERKLVQVYNGKPLLTRPQHEFYVGENYFEIDLDVHRFCYIARKAFETVMDTLKICILDLGLTIQGNKAEELPEIVLCGIRVNGIDYKNYQKLDLTEDPI
ncbi:hypothetical protein RJT34_01893 [Clitoria ternatea]|uniref:Protein ENHANCED DISEASE RESISTANCE 2 C-terminal domain-containing protein n=1 Tax=Clitoria ternatea TaxID=43366 RepID=A0AAN9Q0P4_CLITE